MTKEIGTSNLIDTWGASGAKQEPNEAKKNAGWTSGERPAFQFMNWLQNLFGNKINHILQNGIPLWNTETEYLIGNVVNHNGSIYTAVSDNQNSAPPSANWSVSNTAKDNTALVPPTITNDSSQGYTKGSRWFDTAHNEIYTLIDPAVGAAVWIKISLTIDELTAAFIVYSNLTSGLTAATVQAAIDELVVSLSTKQPLNPRVQSVVSAATVTPTHNTDLTLVTAQAVALTIANPSGSWVEGQAFMIRIKDNGTSKTIAKGSNFRAIGVTIPTATVAGKWLFIAGMYNATDSKWDVTSVGQE